MTRVIGNTFPIRDRLKALGGRWNAVAKCWEVPDDKAEQASRLLFPLSSGAEAIRLATGAPVRPRGGRPPRTCATCGCRINYGVYCGKCEFR